MFAVCSEALVFAVRLPVLILLLGLSAVIPASAEGRDTICLYAASVNVCTDLAERTNERDRRISLFGDAKVQRVCRSRLWLQFYRECTERFSKLETDDRRCYGFLKRLQRNYARDLRSREFRGVDVSQCP